MNDARTKKLLKRFKEKNLSQQNRINLLLKDIETLEKDSNKTIYAISRFSLLAQLVEFHLLGLFNHLYIYNDVVLKTKIINKPKSGGEMIEYTLGLLIGEFNKYNHVYGVKTLIKHLDRLNEDRKMFIHYLFKEAAKRGGKLILYESLMPKANRGSDLCLEIINRFQKLRERIGNANVRYVSGTPDGTIHKYTGKLSQLL